MHVTSKLLQEARVSLLQEARVLSKTNVGVGDNRVSATGHGEEEEEEGGQVGGGSSGRLS